MAHVAIIAARSGARLSAALDKLHAGQPVTLVVIPCSPAAFVAQSWCRANGIAIELLELDGNSTGDIFRAVRISVPRLGRPTLLCEKGLRRAKLELADVDAIVISY
jgi:hypothetical protein